MARKYFGWLGVSLIAGLLLGPLSGVSADQGFYVINKAARPGMLMSVSATDPNVAEPASVDTAESLIGILGDQPTSFDFQDGQKNVLTGGVRNTLVTTVYGDIKKGDFITASSVIGMGAKLVGSGWVVGIAQSDFSSATQGAVTSMVTNEAGRQHEVYAGMVPVLIKVVYHDDMQSEKERDVSFIPESLLREIESITGRKASQFAVMLAFLLLIAGLVIGGLIVYSAVKNGITSISRQPLAKQVIMQRMIQSCIVAFALILASIVGALILIKIF